MASPTAASRRPGPGPVPGPFLHPGGGGGDINASGRRAMSAFASTTMSMPHYYGSGYESPMDPETTTDDFEAGSTPTPASTSHLHRAGHTSTAAAAAAATTGAMVQEGNATNTSSSRSTRGRGDYFTRGNGGSSSPPPPATDSLNAVVVAKARGNPNRKVGLRDRIACFQWTWFTMTMVCPFLPTLKLEPRSCS
jgi:hypothetical protein